MGMSCIACHGWLFRGDRSRYVPRSRAALCLTHTQVVNRFAHQSNLSHRARSWALSRCPAVAWVLRHERKADDSSEGSRWIRPRGRCPACAPAAMASPCRRWMECLHRERLQPDLTQRDMWVMHRSATTVSIRLPSVIPAATDG
jgi:hypothetical protein